MRVSEIKSVAVIAGGDISAFRSKRAYDASLPIPGWFLCLLVLAFLLLGLSGYGLLDDNEGLYAEVAREMLRTGNFVIPHLNTLPYLEKPPLLYYLVALSFTLFGESEFAARMVPVSAAILCMLVLIFFGHRINRPQTGRLAAVMLVTGLGFAILSRTLMIDVLLTALLSASLIFLYLWFEQDKRADLSASYALLGLAVLAKGLVAIVLFGLIATSFIFIARRPSFYQSFKALFDPFALGLFLLIAAPWHILASLYDSHFLWFYFVNEHLLRFLGQREPHDYYVGPVYYYLPRILVSLSFRGHFFFRSFL